MRILLNFSHQTMLNNLSRLDHNYYIPHDQAQWYDTAERDYLEYYSEVPDNLHFDETIDDPDVVVKGENADIHILQTVGQKFKADAINVYQTETMLVLQPPQNQKWVLIRGGIDMKRFEGWKGNLDGKIVTTGNEIRERTHVFDQEKLKGLREKFGDRFEVYGRGVDCDEFVPHERLPEALRNASVYVSIATGSMSPFSIREAMSMGMPVVSLPSRTVRDYITTGYDGVITKDLIEVIEYLREHGDEAKKIGSAARIKARGKYDVKEALKRWESLFVLASRR